MNFYIFIVLFPSWVWYALISIDFGYRDFWRRHKRKIFVSAGVLGTGYVLYKLYNAHRQRLDVLERELANERTRVDELVKEQ